MGIWHKLSIHLGFSENRMGVKNLSGLNRAQILHPPTAMLQIRWYGKASLCTNSPSTYGYATNPMVWKSLLVHKLSIHLRLCHKSDGMEKLPCAQILHPPTAIPIIRWGPWQEEPNELHPHRKRGKSDGAHGKKCQNGLHPFWCLFKSDGLRPNERIQPAQFSAAPHMTNLHLTHLTHSAAISAAIE